MDLVVRAILLAAVATARQPGRLAIYHSGTSTLRPVRWGETGHAVVKFWTRRYVTTHAHPGCRLPAR